MRYLDFDFYSNEWRGKVNQIDFESSCIQAKSVIDMLTYDKITAELLEKYKGKIQYCMCELLDFDVDIQESKEGNISSESIGSHSVSYNNDNMTISRINNKRYEIVDRWLGNTGLMYRGV